MNATMEIIQISPNKIEIATIFTDNTDFDNDHKSTSAS